MLPRTLVALLAAALVAAALAGCANGPSFDPSGPCQVDGQQAGAYPELEALVPKQLGTAPPSSLDSGRTCSDDNLGTLRSHGVTELRFGGGTWETGDRSGTTLAVLSAPGLDPSWVAEFYEASARAAKNTENVTRSDEATDDLSYTRIETLNSDSFQTIAVLQPAVAGRVRVALIASDVGEVKTRAAHEERVALALKAWAQQASGS